jgi:hypothetical protein
MFTILKYRIGRRQSVDPATLYKHLFFVNKAGLKVGAGL